LASPVTQPQTISLTPVQPISPTTSSRPTYQVQSSKLSVTPVSMGTIIPPQSQRLSHSTFPQNPFPPPPGMQLKSNVTPSQSKPPQPSFLSPNYNIYSSPPNNIPTTSPFPMSNIPSSPPQQFSTIPSIPSPPVMGGLLIPSKPANFSSTGTTHVLSKDDWGDFDPLS